MACSKYDKLETGAPSYEKRLKALKLLSRRCRRTIVRVQPYFIDCLNDIIKEVPRYKEAGAFGIIVEGYKSKKKAKRDDKRRKSIQIPS